MKTGASKEESLPEELFEGFRIEEDVH